MNTNYTATDLEGWLREQLKCVSEAIKELEQSHNYGKATMCEGMKEAYTKCLEKIKA